MRVIVPLMAAAAMAVAPASAQVLSPEDRALIVREVVDYLRSNPDALSPLPDAAEVEAVEVPVSGNPDGDVTVFEFSDYGCGPCRAAALAVDEAALLDGGVRVVHHDYPLSGANAAAASADMLAVWRAGGDWEAMRAVYVADGVAPETRIAAMEAAGVDLEALDRGRDGAVRVLLDNRRLAGAAGVNEMPAVIVAVGDRIVPMSGPMEAGDVLRVVARLREAASAP